MNKKKLSKIKNKKSKNKKINKSIKKKQKFLAWTAIIITAINFLLAIAFIVYLYFWVKAR